MLVQSRRRIYDVPGSCHLTEFTLNVTSRLGALPNTPVGEHQMSCAGMQHKIEVVHLTPSSFCLLSFFALLKIKYRRYDQNNGGFLND